LLFAEPNITDLLRPTPWEHPEILTGIGEGIEKAAISVQNSNIFETQQDRTRVTIEDLIGSHICAFDSTTAGKVNIIHYQYDGRLGYCTAND